MADVYVALHISTTADENGVYVAKDAAEIIELAWCLVDATTLEEIHRDSTLVKPINTPITPLCTNLTTLTWEHVRNAGSLKDAVLKLDSFLQDYVIRRNLDFSFIVLNSWDLRMKLPKESRERSIMLPPYLELSRYFDLRKEFSRWQEFVHPEFLAASTASPTVHQMVLQLDVDLSPLSPSSSASASSSNTPSLAPQGAAIAAPAPPSTASTTFALNSAKRAGDEVQIAIQILRALVKKAPYNAPILKQPHDSNLDLKQFFQEKSKILYMSNLPIDTTQSELESWFTQFGGRPIAFWTLKNTSDNHSHGHHHHTNGANGASKPTTNGFAIFATHDEAVDSLSMNGRSLNDRVIEVQPSSIRVLDRSQEILTPFPSSKNRPRPGDWTCPSCGFSNFQRRTACFRCSFPAASAAAIQESMYSNKGINGYNQQQQQQQHHQRSQQQQTQHHQQQQQYHQHQVQMSHQGSQYQHQQLHSNHHNGAHNNYNTKSEYGHYVNGGHNHMAGANALNIQGQQQNRNASSVPFRAGDWKCDTCLYHNFAKNISCLKCGSARSGNTGNRQGLQQTASGSQINLPQQQQQQQQFSQHAGFYPSAQQQQQPLNYSQSSTPLSSAASGATLAQQYGHQLQQPNSELMLNQINSFSLNSNLYRTNTGSTNTTNSNSNLASQQQQQQQ